MKFLLLICCIFCAGFAAAKSKKEDNNDNLSDVDSCISFMQKHLKYKNTSRALGGIVGLGWDDLSNTYTLPVLSVTYQKCLTDPDNRYLVPDNVYLIPVKNTALDRTSSFFESYDEYTSSSSDKLTITGSASFKGKASVSASFSKENSETKSEFVKVNSVMLQNKLSFHAFDLIANENAGFDKNFIRRVKEIASAVKNGYQLKAQFLAEVLISDYGTHVINKATASAEIIQETFISKKEVFKGEAHMSAIKAGVSGEFDGQSYGGSASVANENKQESSNNDTETTSSTRSIIKTRGGPNINRLGTPNINDSMVHVDNLVGINQQGKYLYDVIPAVPLQEFSKTVKFKVKELVSQAVKSYYKFNSLPGCMKMESENFNPLANFEDGSCDDPGFLHTFGGVYQACSPLFSWAGYANIEFGNQCERYERRNRKTGGMSCPNETQPILINSMKLQFYERTVKQQRRKCWKFIPYCWYEEVDVEVMDEIYIASYYCTLEQNITSTQHEKDSDNPLNIIMRQDLLSIIEKMPDVLKLFFPRNFDFMTLMKNETVCGFERKDLNSTEKVKVSWQTIQDRFMENGQSYFCRSCRAGALQITHAQMEMLLDFPQTLEALLPILDLEPSIKNHPDLFKNAAQNALVLQRLIFKEFDNLDQIEYPQPAYFGGIYRNQNINPFTGRADCPPFFETIEISETLNICVSYDSHLKWPIRLGKIFKCNVLKEEICPKGYSEYVAATIDNCDYKYCIRFQTRDEIAPPTINKPPYIDYKNATTETKTSKSSDSKSSKSTKFEF